VEKKKERGKVPPEKKRAERPRVIYFIALYFSGEGRRGKKEARRKADDSTGDYRYSKFLVDVLGEKKKEGKKRKKQLHGKGGKG